MAREAELDSWVGHQLKELRSERRITLTALSEQTGISVAHLSRLEKGHRQPSVGSLLQIARAYGVSLSELIQERALDDHLVRATEATERSGQEGRYTVLSGPGSAIAAIRLELKAGKSTKDAKHIGEEWLHVLAGDITLRVAGKDFSLGTGDSIHFDSSQVHRVTNEGRRAATVLVASTAATMPMHHPVPLPRTRR